jgi:hypothetical protein
LFISSAKGCTYNIAPFVVPLGVNEIANRRPAGVSRKKARRDATQS